MFNAFKQALIKYNKPYVLVSGGVHDRMKTATKEIDKLLNK
jgi:nicotinamide riboside kinase